MQVRQIGFLLFLIFLFSASAFGQINNEAIRVRLERSRQEFIFEGMGVQVFGRESNYDRVSIPRPQKIQITRSQIEGRPIWRIVRSQGSQSFTEIIYDQVLAVKGIFLKANEKNLPQQIFLWPQGRLKFDLVAVIPLQEYLMGVLAGEMPASWPLQTLKSQAIAARSYALAVMQERSSQYFHVEDSVLDQVYSSNVLKSESIRRAVLETNNLVLTDKKGRILKTFFHSDCGGKTADARDVWGRGSRTDVVSDSSCPTNPKAKWELRISVQELNQELLSLTGKGGGELESMVPINGGGGERAYELELKWKNGFKKNILAQDFRQLLGFDKLKSTYFKFRKEKADYVFSGQGYGHGVGMCQWGAKALANTGKDYIEILKHYYPQASLYLRQYQMPEPVNIIKPELRLGLLKQRQQL